MCDFKIHFISQNKIQSQSGSCNLGTDMNGLIVLYKILLKLETYVCAFIDVKFNEM